MFITSSNIILNPNPILREKCEEVSLPLNKEDKDLLTDMLEYVRNSRDENFCEQYDVRPSVGIAAPQIGVNKKMLAISITYSDDDPLELALVNPKIISNSTQKAYLEGGESCLSVVPDVKGYVPRYNKVTFKAFDLIQNKEITMKLSGYEAIVFQHEYDHLVGHLYFDHINKADPFKEIQNAIII